MKGKKDIMETALEALKDQLGLTEEEKRLLLEKLSFLDGNPDITEDELKAMEEIPAELEEKLKLAEEEAGRPETAAKEEKTKQELTETETALLLSGKYGEQRIRNGELTPDETEDLKVIRYTVRRIQELYPGRKIVFTGMEPAVYGRTGYTFTACDFTQGREQPFTVSTEISGTRENPVYACSDTLAGILLRPDFEAYTGRLLTAAGLNLHGFRAELPFRADESFDRTKTAEELIGAGKCPGCSIRLDLRAGGMDQAEFDTCVKRAGDLFRVRGLTGSVLVLGYGTAGNEPLPGGWNSWIFRARILL